MSDEAVEVCMSCPIDATPVDHNGGGMNTSIRC